MQQPPHFLADQAPALLLFFLSIAIEESPTFVINKDPPPMQLVLCQIFLALGTSPRLASPFNPLTPPATRRYLACVQCYLEVVSPHVRLDEDAFTIHWTEFRWPSSRGPS